MQKLIEEEEQVAKKTNGKKKGSIKEQQTNEDAEKKFNDDADENVDKQETEPPAHESLLKDKEELDKAEATVFVGNVVNEAITDKKVFKEFENLFKKHGKVQSIRFRSIAFAVPLPRKAAIAQRQLHPSRDNVNAYVVFKEKASVKSALELNGTIFKDHHIRVDSVAHPSPQENKRSVFVGNLSFEATEEPLWKHFGDCGDIESVRIVRDAKTNVGKGFAYIQFKDSVSVEKALLLNDKPFKFGDHKPRSLRVTRAKKMRPTKRADEPSVKKSRLSADAKAKVGRARSMLGKAGKSAVDKAIEGTRAKPGDVVPGLKVGSGKKRRKPRLGRSRSSNFKKTSTK
jgi:nucleolar protein 12